MKIKTSELTGKGLDWAVSMVVREDVNFLIEMSDVIPAYSISWNMCGLLIDEYLDSLTRMCIDSPWVASCKAVTVDDVSIWKVEGGQTPQIAICRAVVSAKLGDEVDIPDELLEAE
ncbi:DUF2591 domain-containing protein [Xenorhabdus sp. KK7.4]|uniref:DUF2591 domain-containing protein n=1 Tax=Xenorhabdus sp. KK7.4 TaxID=1851572 RepID=UPI000C04E39E|nr:DUF2591 domain-containing protein [Xenorhabdus sp. KK7.4]PHM49081.1 hypothetical protein Xekk_04362 [Xenorhabdus sp. KK7.4]